MSIRSLFVPNSAQIPSVSSPGDLPLAQILRDGRKVEVTPSLAARILNECRYLRQRPVKEWRVAYQVGEMKAGRFKQGRQISFALLDGSLILVNGYHRNTAVVRSGRAQTFMIEVVEVETPQEVAELYATYDVGGAERSMLETAGELLVQGDLSNPQLSALLRAVQIISTHFRKPSVNEDATILYSRLARGNVARAWYPYAEQYFALTSDAVPQVKTALHRQPVVAVALMTLKHEPEKAEEFWKGLAMDDGLARNDPRKALLEKLRSHEAVHSIPAQLQAVAAGWNAFYEGRRLKEIRVRPDKPFTIAGTKIVGRHFNGCGDDRGKNSN